MSDFFIATNGVKQDGVMSPEASYHIYTSQWSVINVKANFCAYNVWIKF